MFHFQNDISFSQIDSLILKQHTQLEKPFGTLGCKLVIRGWFFSFFSILWCNQTSNHQQEYLAKFGYIPNMSIFKNPFSFWLPVGMCCRDLVVFIYLFFEIWQIRAVFCCSQKPLNVLKSLFSKFEFAMWRI
jgi:hypothetical protein